MTCLNRIHGTLPADKQKISDQKKGGLQQLPSFFIHFFPALPASRPLFPLTLILTSRPQTFRPQTFRLSVLAIASSTLSGVNGTLNSLAPVALKMAFPTAAPTAIMAGSPPPWGG